MSRDLQDRIKRAIEESEHGCEMEGIYPASEVELRGLLTEALGALTQRDAFLTAYLADPVIGQPISLDSLSREDGLQAKRNWDQLDAERDDLRRQLAEVQAERNAIRERFMDCVRPDGLKYNIGHMLHTEKEIRADNAALVETLNNLQTFAEVATEIGPAWLVGQVQTILSQPHPGARMLEELAALRKVEGRFRAILETLECACDDGYTCTIHADRQILDHLDTIHNRNT